MKLIVSTLCMKPIIFFYDWCDGHFISINTCGMWKVRAEVQVFRRKFHIHVHLDQVRIEFYLVKIKKLLYKREKNKSTIPPKTIIKHITYVITCHTQEYTYHIFSICKQHFKKKKKKKIRAWTCPSVHASFQSRTETHFWGLNKNAQR